jgi:hypothetical protein
VQQNVQKPSEYLSKDSYVDKKFRRVQKKRYGKSNIPLTLDNMIDWCLTPFLAICLGIPGKQTLTLWN